MKYLILVLAVLITLPAYAKKSHKHEWKPCHNDIRAYCGTNNRHDTNAMIHCLSRYKKQISYECREHVNYLKGNTTQSSTYSSSNRYVRYEACRQEEKAYCKYVDSRHMKACLLDHKYKITERCRQALED